MFVAEWQCSTGSVARQCSVCQFQSVVYICVFHLLIVSIVLLLWTANCCDVDDYAAGWSSVPLRTKSSADVHIGHRKSVTSEPAGTSANRRRQVADVDVVKNSSVVTTTKLSPPPRWLATIEPYSVVGSVSGRCFMKTAPHSFADLRESSKCCVIWSRANARRHRPPPPPPRVRFSTLHRPCCRDSRDAPGTVLHQTVAMVWFSTCLRTVTAIIQSAMRTHVNVRHCTLTDTYNIWLFPTW